MEFLSAGLWVGTALIFGEEESHKHSSIAESEVKLHGRLGAIVVLSFAQRLPSTLRPLFTLASRSSCVAGCEVFFFALTRRRTRLISTLLGRGA